MTTGSGARNEHRQASIGGFKMKGIPKQDKYRLKPKMQSSDRVDHEILCPRTRGRAARTNFVIRWNAIWKAGMDEDKTAFEHGQTNVTRERTIPQGRGAGPGPPFHDSLPKY